MFLQIQRSRMFKVLSEISRQRFWGSPLPVWKCEDCKEYVVIESRKELKKLKANKIPEDLHKPWVDEVTLPCKCGSTMKRNPDIMDVWIDAGVDSWASLGFPHDEKLFKKLFPADFITEGKDQIRGWFNLLFVASMLALEDISFKTCYMTGFVNDAQGHGDLGSMVSAFSGWANSDFSGAYVGFQVGYESDPWIFDLSNPVKDVGDALKEAVGSNMKTYFWVDFTLPDVID